MHSLPDALTSTFQDALVCSCIALTKDERPITWPGIPHAGANGTLCRDGTGTVTTVLPAVIPAVDGAFRSPPVLRASRGFPVDGRRSRA
ncbi:hypothetical protein AB0F88_08525 [Streptosporangium sp. NPDC023963]|uniref:hypothetical protein n=1 Tax=Streptosporangium sp. NPDC023963 TaxID=3155608 RepID=UPI003437684C